MALYAIIADLHANLEAARAVFSDIDKRNVDGIYCLGDVVSYNANPNEVVDEVRSRDIPTLMGNHDAVAAGLEESYFFREAARKAVEWTRDSALRADNKAFIQSFPEGLYICDGVIAVHGAITCRDDYIMDWIDAMRNFEVMRKDYANVRVGFFGHSHCAGVFPEIGQHRQLQPDAEGKVPISLTNGQRYLINPGSVGQPRDRDPRSAYGLLDTDAETFQFCRVGYDIEAVQRKIRAAGLPERLATRLAEGK